MLVFNLYNGFGYPAIGYRTTRLISISGFCHGVVKIITKTERISAADANRITTSYSKWHIVWIIWDSKGTTIIWGMAVTNGNDS